LFKWPDIHRLKTKFFQLSHSICLMKHFETSITTTAQVLKPILVVRGSVDQI